MPLWIVWFDALRALRPACRRLSTFLWMTLVLIGLSCRPERAGVTSLVRLFGFGNKGYRRFLHLFHSSALDLETLTACWVRLCLVLFQPFLVGSRLVCLADGIKAPKEGRKMPAVKLLHQQSASNSKPEYIMGHSFQAVSLLVQGAGGHVAAVPLVSRIHEGLVWSNRDTRTLLDKLALLLFSLTLEPMEIILLYGYRFKIELGFRQAVHVVGSYAYHFWMAAMKPRRRSQGDQYLHRESQTYRDAVRRKINAFHLHVQLGCVAQGLLEHLAINYSAQVWRQFRSWLRTMNPALPPSQLVVAIALRAPLGDFLAAAPLPHKLRIILHRYREPINASQCNDCGLEAAA